jgi:hypothetical protein
MKSRVLAGMALSMALVAGSPLSASAAATQKLNLSTVGTFTFPTTFKVPTKKKSCSQMVWSYRITKLQATFGGKVYLTLTNRKTGEDLSFSELIYDPLAGYPRSGTFQMPFCNYAKVEKSGYRHVPSTKGLYDLTLYGLDGNGASSDALGTINFR